MRIGVPGLVVATALLSACAQGPVRHPLKESATARPVVVSSSRIPRTVNPDSLFETASAGVIIVNGEALRRSGAVDAADALARIHPAVTVR